MVKQDHKTGRACICIVRHSFYPAELNVKREAETLAEYGYAVHVICLRNPGETASEIVNGVHIWRMPVGHRRGKITRYLIEYNAFFVLAAIKLVRLHLRQPLRIIQISTMPDYLVFLTLLLRMTKVKVILHMREPMPELFDTLFRKPWHRPILAAIKIIEGLSLRYADHVLTVTKEMREKFSRRGIHCDKITVIHNTPDEKIISQDQYAHLRGKVVRAKEADRRKGVFRLLCHGTIEHRYGLDLVVEAVAQVKDIIPGVEFRFMGTGTGLPAVLARAEELNVTQQVKYLGFLPLEHMVEEVLCADLSVVPMRRNPYSVLVHTNKMFEYIALARPVVASRLTSVANYFPENTLLYFAPDDHTDLAAKVLYAFHNPDEMRKRILRCSAIYESLCWRHESVKYLRVFDMLLGDAYSCDIRS